MTSVILIVLLVFFIVAPAIASVIGLVHAIIDSVTKKRFPNIFALILLLLGIFFLIVWKYGDNLYTASEGMISLCFLGLPWHTLRIVLQACAFVPVILGLAWYILLSFREDSVRGFGKSRKKKKATDSNAEHTESETGEQDTETREEVRKSNRRTALLYRILTACTALVLVGIAVLYIILAWYVAGLSLNHDMIEYTSPDGEYTIVIDNLQSGTAYGSDVYLRLNPFKVRKLQEKESRRKYMDITYEDITWEDQGFSIPYGNVKLFYYYEPVESTD